MRRPSVSALRQKSGLRSRVVVVLVRPRGGGSAVRGRKVTVNKGPSRHAVGIVDLVRRRAIEGRVRRVIVLITEIVVLARKGVRPKEEGIAAVKENRRHRSITRSPHFLATKPAPAIREIASDERFCLR